jgi:Domain of unknown function (DUF1330)
MGTGGLTRRSFDTRTSDASVCHRRQRGDRFSGIRGVSSSGVERYGDTFLVRGGHRTLDGDWKPKRIVVAEFRSPEQDRR